MKKTTPQRTELRLGATKDSAENGVLATCGSGTAATRIGGHFGDREVEPSISNVLFVVFPLMSEPFTLFIQVLLFPLLRFPFEARNLGILAKNGNFMADLLGLEMQRISFLGRRWNASA